MRPDKNEARTSTGATNSAICALEPMEMLTARSILFLAATSTATQCSAALPTIATTITPTKNSLSPIVSDASEIEPTRISDISADREAGAGQRDDRRPHRPRLAVDVLLLLGRRVEQIPVGPSENSRPAP